MIKIAIKFTSVSPNLFAFVIMGENQRKHLKYINTQIQTKYLANNDSFYTHTIHIIHQQSSSHHITCKQNKQTAINTNDK